MDKIKCTVFFVFLTQFSGKLTYLEHREGLGSVQKNMPESCEVITVVAVEADYGPDVALSALRALLHLILFGCHIIAVSIPQTNT